MFNDEIVRGIQFLNEKNPGWEKYIDLAELDMSNPCKCVFGQLYGTYAKGRDKFNLSTAQCIRLGFIFLGFANENPGSDTHTTEWNEAIQQLRIK